MHTSACVLRTIVSSIVPLNIVTNYHGLEQKEYNSIVDGGNVRIINITYPSMCVLPKFDYTLKDCG